QVGFVGVPVHEGFDFGGVGDLELGEPAGGFGRGIDGLGRIAQRAVGLDHLAGDGGVDVGRGFDALDYGEAVAGLEGLADVGGLDEHHVAQLFGGVGGDADGRDVAVDLDPLVILGEAHGRVLLGELSDVAVGDEGGFDDFAGLRL